MPNYTDRPFTFHFVRHGETEPNVRGLRCGGDLDVPLTDIGCDQSYLLAKQLKRMNLGITVMLVGSLMRTRQTASIISGVLGNVPVHVEPLLNERRLGEWNRQPVEGTEDLLLRGATPPGGESDAYFEGRVAEALKRIRAHYLGVPLVVSSRGVGRVLNSLLGGNGRLSIGNAEVVEFASSPPSEGRVPARVIAQAA